MEVASAVYKRESEAMNELIQAHDVHIGYLGCRRLHAKESSGMPGLIPK